MFSSNFPILFVVSTAAGTLSTSVLPDNISNGFVTPITIQSAGGKAMCVTGMTEVPVTATNNKLLYENAAPANQLAATETILEMLQTNSKFATTTYGGPNNVTGSFNIYSKLCYPAKITNIQSVQNIQFLTHGATLDHNFWDIVPKYSYVDAAAEAGYATFSYDRLGIGKSDHPDPIQIVQAPIQLEITHILVQRLRTAQLGGKSFRTVVGVGHSAGSTFTQGITSKYPDDFDAVILTGTSANFGTVGASLAAFDLTIANTDPSGRLKGIANGYFTQSEAKSIQFSFWRYPSFDEKVFNKFVDLKQTNTLGELLTLGSILSPSINFTGPIDVLLGENDHVFCGGDCTYPEDGAAQVISDFYPHASNGSLHFLAPNAGHCFIGHESTSAAFAQMIAFLKSNGILASDSEEAAPDAGSASQVEHTDL